MISVDTSVDAMNLTARALWFHRYRNFETLHTRLTATSEAYRSLKVALPSKWLFTLNPDSGFVHQRRRELDAYLSQILRSGIEGNRDDERNAVVLQSSFPGNCMYYVAHANSYNVRFNRFPPTALLQDVWLFLKPGSDYAPGPISGRPPLTHHNTTHNLQHMASLGPPGPAGHVPTATMTTTTRHRRHRSATHSDDFVLVGKGSGGAKGDGGPSSSKDDHELLAMHVRVGDASRSGGGGSSRGAGLGSSLPQRGVLPPLPPFSHGRAEHSFGGVPHQMFGGHRPPDDTLHMTPGRDMLTMSGSASPSTAEPGSSQPRVRLAGLSEADPADYADSMGASAPLLDLVDIIFELHSRGFMWRQVCLFL